MSKREPRTSSPINLNNRQYWAGRQEYLSERLLDKGETFYESMVIEYDRAINSINDEIEKFYGRFAVNNELDLTTAKRILTTDERRRFQLKIDEYIEKGRTLPYSKEWEKVLENASTVFRISRLQEVQLHMHQTIEELHAKYEPRAKKTLGGIYTDGYYLQLHELAKGMQAAVRFDRVDQNYVEKLVAKPWAPSGRNFSENIWQQRTELNYFLETRLTQGLMKGEGKATIIKEMANKFKTSKSNAGRLIMTETAYFASVATNDAYQTFGVEQYEFLATLDFRTSHICQSMDGTIHKQSDYSAGKTAPPLHSHCRSTTLPVLSDIWDEDDVGRAARGRNGQYVRVPSNINYDTWFNEYAN